MQATATALGEAGSGKKERLHALDGLRSIAATLVVAHHLGVSAAAQALRERGFAFVGNLLGSFTASGVELFFVLSAIVLAGPYVRRERQMNLRSYAFRRLERLMPPYLAAWLLAGLAIYLASVFPTWWTLGAGLPVFSIGTWLSQIGIIYLGFEAFNFAWWSLTVEVAFYLVLPLLIPTFARLTQPGLQRAFVGSLLIALLFAPWAGSIILLHNLALYASCFCTGLFLARGVPGARARMALIVGGAAWVLASCWQLQLNVHIGWGLVYFGVVATAMDHRTTLSTRLSSYGFVWLGERSYSLFLVHFSVIGLVCQASSFMFDQKSIGYFVVTRVLSLLLSMGAAIIVFQVVERRFARNLQTADDILPNPGRGLRQTAAAH